MQPVIHLRVVVGMDGDNAIIRRVSAYDELTLADRVVEAVVQSGRIYDFIPSPGPEEAPEAEGGAPEEAPAESAVSFADYATKWFSTYKKGLAKTTENFYRGKMNVFIEAFGGMPISAITPEDIQLFLTRRAESFTKKTVRDDLAILRDIMNSAMEDGLIARNPTKDRRVRNNAPATSGTQALTRDQVATIQRDIPRLKDPVERCLIALLAYTSMRREEVLGLKWDRVDFERNKLLIDRAVVYTGGHMYEKGAKTQHSVREFPMCPALREILLTCRQEGGYGVHSGDSSRPVLTHNRYQKLWASLGEHIELYGSTARNFRTTFATLAIASGVDVKTTQKLMGHANAKMTMDVYAKVDPGQYDQAMERLGSFLAA